MSFSERMGFSNPKNILLNNIDKDMRTGFVNCYTVLIQPNLEKFVDPFKTYIFHTFLKIEVNDDTSWEFDKRIKNIFRESKWNTVLDTLEALAEGLRISQFRTLRNIQSDFIDLINGVLIRECSAYRFIDNCIAPISSDQESEAIASAMQNGDSTALHIANALRLFSDRNNPDYANSIKESISAVEAICQKIAGKKGAPLGAALKSIQGKNLMPVHPSFASGMEKLYGYTSDANGIRHANSDPNARVTQEEAQFMLIICSAFVNYMRVLANKAGISLE